MAKHSHWEGWKSGLVLQGSDSLRKLDIHKAFLKETLPKDAALNPHSGPSHAHREKLQKSPENSQI